MSIKDFVTKIRVCWRPSKPYFNENIKGVLAQVQGTNIRVRQTIEYGYHLINELTGKTVFMKVSANLMEGAETRRSNVKTLQL